MTKNKRSRYDDDALEEKLSDGVESVNTDSASVTNQLDAESVKADKSTVGSLNTDASRNKDRDNTLIVSPDAQHYDTIQDAVNAIESTSNDIAKNEVLVLPKDGAWQETIDLTGGEQPSTASLRGLGLGQATHIEGSGGHAIQMDGNDAYLQSMWVDQVDSPGSIDRDAIFISEREARVYDVSVDYSPRDAIHVSTPLGEAHIRDVEIQGATRDAIRLNGPQNIVRGATIKGPDGNAINLRGTAVNNKVDATITDIGGLIGFMEAGARRNHLDLTVNNPTEPLRCWGSKNTITLTSEGGTENVLEIEQNSSNNGGQDNTVYLNIDGDVLLGSGTAGNVLYGRVGGKITDNGTGNDTSNAA